MINVEEAIALISKQSIKLSSETIPMASALGRILAEPISADRDFPPYNRITMDGIAIRFEDFAEGNRQFAIQGIQAAGDPQQTLQQPNSCLEVMTGAMMPKNADTIIRYEDLEIQNGTASLTVETIKEGQNIHRQGSDRPQGTTIIEKGTRISPTEIAILASVGKAEVSVKARPRIAVISTGDELVKIEEQPKPHQIRRSNSHMLDAALREHDFSASLHHLNDDKQIILSALKQLMTDNDVLILSGGVSKGKFDYLPEAFETLGVSKVFHKVKQRPGKPFWFGYSTTFNTVVFALPGNPVSTFICTHRYVIPWLHQQSGRNRIGNLMYKLSEDVHFKPDLTYFVPVKLEVNENEVEAHPLKGNGSGDFANLVHADGFIELPKGALVYKKGSYYHYFKF